MRFYSNNPEKKDKKKTELIIKAALGGVVIGLFCILAGISIKFLIKLLIKYWIYVVVAIAVIMFAKNFLLKRKSRIYDESSYR